MQFVLNKLGFSNYKFTTASHKAEAYSPFHSVSCPSTFSIFKI